MIPTLCRESLETINPESFEGFIFLKLMNRELLLNTAENKSSIFEPQINPLLRLTRERDGAIKLFYAHLRSLREEEVNVVDIGAGIEVDELESTQILPIINFQHQRSDLQGHNLYKEYPSSWGTMELRHALADHFVNRGVSTLDPKNEVMVTHGIMDAYDKTLQALDISWVIVPSWAPYYARSHALINGKTVVEVPLDPLSGNLNLIELAQRLKSENSTPGKILMYLCQPSSPLGTLMEDEFIRYDLIPFLNEYGVLVFSDYYASTARYDGGNGIRPLLSYPGMKDLAVEAITVSKEHGIPGIRIGGVAGNPEIINAIRLLSASKIDIVPAISQLIAAQALCEVDLSIVGNRVIHEVRDEVLPRLRKMKWPMIEPKAGLDMVVQVPLEFMRSRAEDPSLLATFTLLRRYGVAFCPCSVYGPLGRNYLRIVLKQKAGKVPAALDHLANNGFNWQTESPSEEDIVFLGNLLAQLDLTKL